MIAIKIIFVLFISHMPVIHLLFFKLKPTLFIIILILFLGLVYFPAVSILSSVNRRSCFCGEPADKRVGDLVVPTLSSFRNQLWPMPLESLFAPDSCSSCRHTLSTDIQISALETWVLVTFQFLHSSLSFRNSGSFYLLLSLLVPMESTSKCPEEGGQWRTVLPALSLPSCYNPALPLIKDFSSY